MGRSDRVLLVIACIVALAARLTVFTESRIYPSAFGDEKNYLGLALKIENAGFSDYNLRGLDFFVVDDTFILQLSEDPQGHLLKTRNRDGLKLDDLALHYSPPLFPLLLAVSHRVLSPGDSCALTVVPPPGNPTPLVHPARPLGQTVRLQLYAALVPFTASLVTCLVVFLLGRLVATPRVGAVAALLFAVAPIDILAAHRVWADTLAAAVTAAALFMLFAAWRQRSLLLLYGAAAALGLSLLAKNSGVINIALAMVFPPLLARWTKSTEDPSLPPFFTSARLLMFAGIILAIALPWYALALKHHGTLLYNPSVPGISQVSPYFRWLNTRPWYTYLADIPYQNPLLVLGFFACVQALVQPRRSMPELILTIWFLTYLGVLTVQTSVSEMSGPENRYMLPAYPPLCILAAIVFCRRLGAPASTSQAGSIRNLMFWGLLAASCLRSLFIAYRAFLQHEHFLAVPF